MGIKQYEKKSLSVNEEEEYDGYGLHYFDFGGGAAFAFYAVIHNEIALILASNDISSRATFTTGTLSGPNIKMKSLASQSYRHFQLLCEF